MDRIDAIRSFNRLYIRRLGVLGSSYLGSGVGVTDVRLLHDLARNHAGQPIRARDLSRQLGLDEGQVSRSLARFETSGWIVRRPVPGDARAREVQLSKAGRRLVAVLEKRSRGEVGAMLADLGENGSNSLASAFATAARLLEEPVGEIVLRDLAPGDAGWVIARHGALYAEDEGYDSSFEALVAEIVAGFLRAADRVRERGWIAERCGHRLGSIFCMRDDDRTARLRLFLLERSERGTGLAQRMIDVCVGFARQAGYARMRLWTHESHCAAGRLYARNGFRLVASAPARAFGQDTVDQEWECDLRPDATLAIAEGGG